MNANYDLINKGDSLQAFTTGIFESHHKMVYGTEEIPASELAYIIRRSPKFGELVERIRIEDVDKEAAAKYIRRLERIGETVTVIKGADLHD